MTPSLRARATRPFLVPRRFATPIAQLLSEDMRTVDLIRGSAEDIERAVRFARRLEH